MNAPSYSSEQVFFKNIINENNSDIIVTFPTSYKYVHICVGRVLEQDILLNSQKPSPLYSTAVLVYYK